MENIEDKSSTLLRLHHKLVREKYTFHLKVKFQELAIISILPKAAQL